MGPNIHMYEQVLAEHREALRREGEQRRVLAQQPHPQRNIGRHIVGSLGVRLVALGSRMEQFERRGEPVWN